MWLGAPASNLNVLVAIACRHDNRSQVLGYVAAGKLKPSQVCKHVPGMGMPSIHQMHTVADTWELFAKYLMQHKQLWSSLVSPLGPEQLSSSLALHGHC